MVQADHLSVLPFHSHGRLMGCPACLTNISQAGLDMAHCARSLVQRLAVSAGIHPRAFMQQMQAEQWRAGFSRCGCGVALQTVTTQRRRTADPTRYSNPAKTRCQSAGWKLVTQLELSVQNASSKRLLVRCGPEALLSGDHCWMSLPAGKHARHHAWSLLQDSLFANKAAQACRRRQSDHFQHV